MKPAPVLIKKYQNRRLYDSSNSQYVNLDDIAGFIREGKDVQIVDAKTGQDLTRCTAQASARIFAVSSDHFEIGRIQGRQFAALLPGGGSVLYIEGPSQSSSAQERKSGMLETKPSNIQVRMLKARWTEESALRAVRSWLKMATSQSASINLVTEQDDSMAMGARKAFQEITNEAERSRWLSLPFTGCDGQPATGQAWVREKWLTATIHIPPLTGQAMEILAKAIQDGTQPPEHAFTTSFSIPPFESLVPRNP